MICRELRVLDLFSKMNDNVFTVKLKDAYLAKQENAEDKNAIIGIYLVTDFYSISLDTAIYRLEEKFNQD